ncbi:pimeloyl-ACP methyl ester carboxylesterase [Paraburkholderia youngii]
MLSPSPASSRRARSATRVTVALPIRGYSFMDYLARAGFDVYAVDARGYGESTRPQQMRVAAAQSEPLGRTESGLRDFTSAVNFVLRTSGIARINVIGMSWGGSVSGAFTARNGRKVRRLGLVAPQWVSDKPIPLDPGGPLGGYRMVRAADARERWVNAAPEWKRSTLIPDGGFEAWLDNTVRTEPDEALRENQSIRVANGPIQDIREYRATSKCRSC